MGDLVCCLEKPRGGQKEGGEEGAPCFKKQGMGGGRVKSGVDGRSWSRGGGKGRPAGAVAGPRLRETGGRRGATSARP